MVLRSNATSVPVAMADLVDDARSLVNCIASAVAVFSNLGRFSKPVLGPPALTTSLVGIGEDIPFANRNAKAATTALHKTKADSKMPTFKMDERESLHVP